MISGTGREAAQYQQDEGQMLGSDGKQGLE